MGKANLFHVVKAVLSSFFGVRKRVNLDDDAARIKPIQVVFVGIVCAVVGVLGLVALVSFIAR